MEKHLWKFRRPPTFLTITLFTFLFLINKESLAHCPLCTVGSAGLSIGAVWIGAKILVVGIFVGAFAFAMSSWMTNLLVKKFRIHRAILLPIFFFSTILPLKGVFPEYTSLYINFGGEYGTIFNRTYLINKFILGSLLGALIVYSSPYLSKNLSKLTGKRFPYQGIIITLSILIIVAIIFQLRA